RERVAALAAVLDHELEALVGTRGRTVDAVRTGRVAVRQIAETDVRELGAVAVGPVRLHQQLRAPADPVLNEDPLARADLPGLVWTEVGEPRAGRGAGRSDREGELHRARAGGLGGGIDGRHVRVVAVRHDPEVAAPALVAEG